MSIVYYDEVEVTSSELSLRLNNYKARFVLRSNGAILGEVQHVIQFPTVLRPAFDTDNGSETTLHASLVADEGSWWAVLVNADTDAVVNSWPKIEFHK